MTHHVHGDRVALLLALSATAVATAMWFLLILNMSNETSRLTFGAIAVVLTLAALVLFALAYTRWTPKKYREMDLHEPGGLPWTKIRGR